eukprot:1680549-Pyramimonas_sp.AAC.1
MESINQARETFFNRKKTKKEVVWWGGKAAAGPGARLEIEACLESSQRGLKQICADLTGRGNPRADPF